MEEKRGKIFNIVKKSLFIVLILVILILLAFAVIRFIPFVFSSFASAGKALRSNFEPGVEISISKNELESGESFRVYWQYQNESNGQYNIRFNCANNLRIFVDNPSQPELICDRDYPLSPNDSFIDLKVVLEKENAYVESEIEISYTDPQNSKSEQVGFSVINETTVPVNDLSGSATISSSEPTSNSNSNQNNGANTSTNNTGNTSVQVSGPADLAITNARAINDTTVVFDISNIGGRSTGSWYFSYVIPGEDIEISPLQISLNPGNTIRYTLTFDDIESGNTVIVTDPNNVINEVSNTNNVATIFVQGDGGNGGGSSNTGYDPDDEADLVIRNLEVGYMDGSRFREDDEIDDNDDAAIRFEVANIGGESTDSWRFEINETPYDGSDNDYRSGRQSSLRPGEVRTIIVEFENPDEGRYDIEVEVDSDDDVDEENERNNDDSEVLRVRD